MMKGLRTAAPFLKSKTDPCTTAGLFLFEKFPKSTKLFRFIIFSGHYFSSPQCVKLSLSFLSIISCGKLRENYSRLTAEIGCTCDFQRIKNCYPSPVLHALKGSSEESSDITIPTSRTLTKESEKKVYSQLNTSQQVKEILQKILEMKKQRRAIDRNIEKGEKELERLFDEAHIESLESDYGLLVRRKIDKGYEWVVEF